METALNQEPDQRKTHPWLEIWVQPRQTIRSLLDSSDPEKNMIKLSMVGGIVSALDRASSRNLGDDMSMLSLFLVVLVGGSIGGILGLYLLGAILSKTGGWLGGTATSSEIRVAITRGYYVPTIMVAILWIPQLLLAGKEMFTSATPHLDSSPGLAFLQFLLLLVESVFMVWSFVIALKSIGEAHQFSALKAFWSAIIPGLALVAFFVLLFGLLSLLL